jgi:hypothetical protein
LQSKSNFNFKAGEARFPSPKVFRSSIRTTSRESRIHGRYVRAHSQQLPQPIDPGFDVYRLADILRSGSVLKASCWFYTVRGTPAGAGRRTRPRGAAPARRYCTIQGKVKKDIASLLYAGMALLALSLVFFVSLAAFGYAKIRVHQAAPAVLCHGHGDGHERVHRMMSLSR